MIPRGALLQAMESEGFSPQDQGRLLRAVDALMADSTEAFGGGVLGDLDSLWDELYCLADGHNHESRVEEALCSLRFQRNRGAA